MPVMPNFCDPVKPTFKQRQEDMRTLAGTHKCGIMVTQRKLERNTAYTSRLGIRSDMEINEWKWHNEEICTEIEQFRWETSSMDRVLANITQHKQWPSVYHWTLKPKTPSKQCQAVCPFILWQGITLLPFPARPTAQPACWTSSTSASGACLHLGLLLCNCTPWILCCLFLGLGLKIVQV